MEDNSRKMGTVEKEKCEVQTLMWWQYQGFPKGGCSPPPWQKRVCPSSDSSASETPSPASGRRLGSADTNPGGFPVSCSCSNLLLLLFLSSPSLGQHEAVRSSRPLHRSLSEVRRHGGQRFFQYPFEKDWHWLWVFRKCEAKSKDLKDNTQNFCCHFTITLDSTYSFCRVKPSVQKVKRKKLLRWCKKNEKIWKLKVSRPQQTAERPPLVSTEEVW